MTSLQQALSRLQQYSKKVEGQDEDELTGADVEETYAGRIDKSLQSLQRQLNEHGATSERVKSHQVKAYFIELTFIEQLRAESALSISIEKPDEDTTTRIQQLQTITAAYNSNTLAEPALPSADSPLPALLALRSTLRTIDETKSAVRECRLQITDSHSNFRRTEADLQDARQMTVALEERAERLQLEKAELERDGPEGVINRMVQTQQQKSLQYSEELRRLLIAFNRFVDEHLAVMIAAEQLGGPTVGDDLSINDAMLKMGFDKQGKPKKVKLGKHGPIEEEMDVDGNDTNGAVAGLERKAAAAAMRKLTEELLNALADDENLESYVFIGKETAAVRFLIRAKVAQFHPNDSRKLRLMDFGTEAADPP